MTSQGERRELRDIEPLAPPEDEDVVDTGDDVDDEVAIAGGAGGAGIPAVGVVAEAMVPNRASLDPERDDVDRNAAGGGWEGVNEVIENDFETEQLRRR